MRAQSLLFILALCLLMASCKKKDSNTDNNRIQPATVADLTLMMNTQEEALLQYEATWDATHDTLKALFDMGQWLLNKSGVSRVYLDDDRQIIVIYQSGLRSTIGVTMLGANGRHLTRSGGGLPSPAGGISKYKLGGTANRGAGVDDKIISNNKVMIFVPHLNEFYSGTYPFLSRFAQSRTQLEVTVVSEYAATVGILNTFHDYGFIILDTHGAFDGTFETYTGVPELDLPAVPEAGRWTEAKVTEYVGRAGNGLLKSLLSGELRLGTAALVDVFNLGRVKSSFVVHVTDDYISRMPDKLKDAVVFGNHCFSGNTKSFDVGGRQSGNLPKAWLDAGAAAYYGYAFTDGLSLQVSNDFCKSMEDSLITNLVINGDSTGLAHLAGDVAEQFYLLRRPSIRIPNSLKKGGVYIEYADAHTKSEEPFYFRLFHSPRYRYDCGTFKDPRDGQLYKLACIGEQQWFAENLRYNSPRSLTYENSAANGAKYGRLYNYTEVSAGSGPGSPTAPGFRGICPQGYHVPSDYDVAKLIATLKAKNADRLGIQMKEKDNAWAGDNDLQDPLRNNSEFAGLPGGQANILFNAGNQMVFSDGGSHAYYWMASPQTGVTLPNCAGYLELTGSSSDVWLSSPALGTGPTIADSWFMSCRCVKD